MHETTSQSDMGIPITDRDDELVSVPRWVAGVLAEIAEMNTGCSGGEAREPGCPQCDAIYLANKAYKNG